MKKTIISAVMSAALLSMGSAFAGGGNLFGGSGESSMADGSFYGGASIGQASYRCTMEEDDCKNDGWKVFGGYKFTDNMAIEAGYYNLGEEEADYDTDYGKMHASAKASGIGVTGVYSQPLADNFEVFGKLGAMFWNAEGELSQYSGDTKLTASDEEDGTSVLFGLGASYQFNDNWGVRGEWERYTAEYEDVDKGTDTEEDIDILSAGVTFSTY
jgi:OOP family OmpA-OmpF porin